MLAWSSKFNFYEALPQDENKLLKNPAMILGGRYLCQNLTSTIHCGRWSVICFDFFYHFNTLLIHTFI